MKRWVHAATSQPVDIMIESPEDYLNKASDFMLSHEEGIDYPSQYGLGDIDRYNLVFKDDATLVESLEEVDFDESGFATNAANAKELKKKLNALTHRYNPSLHKRDYEEQAIEVLEQAKANIKALKIRYLRVTYRKDRISRNKVEHKLLVEYCVPDKYEFTRDGATPEDMEITKHNNDEIYKMLTSINALCKVTKNVDHNSDYWRDAYYRVGTDIEDAEVTYIPDILPYPKKPR